MPQDLSPEPKEALPGSIPVACSPSRTWRPSRVSSDPDGVQGWRHGDSMADAYKVELP